MKVLLLSGSFRRNSYSQALLGLVAEELGGTHEIVAHRLDALPFYDHDLALNDRPESLSRFLADVEACDGIIVCSPEYNHSIPAVLKNAIDWASRPAFASPLKDKPVTIITQATGPVGGARAQAHLKLVFDSTLSILHPIHEQMVANVDQKFDADGRLLDESVRLRIKRHLTDFLDFIAT